MKKSLQIFALLFCLIVSAQAPEKFSYQAVIRNASNALITNAPVGVKISILKTSAAGTVVYSESQTATTNANGLISIQIGAGTVISGTVAGINWAADSYYIKTETDPAGGTAYSISGTTQLLSVPYALYSKSSGGGGPAFTLPYSATATNASSLFQLTNNGVGSALEGINGSVGANINAVTGVNNSTTSGFRSAGVRGINNGTGAFGIGVYGSHDGSGWGVLGTTPNGVGIYGEATGAGGVGGEFISNNTGHALVTDGPIRLVSIGAGTGKVLTSDAVGNATFQDLITPNVHLSSLGGSSQSIGSGINVINSWGGLEESGGANYNPATGEYTIPVSGYYSLTAQVAFTTSVTSNALAEVFFQVNGVNLKYGLAPCIAGNKCPFLHVSIEKQLSAGDKVTIAVDHTYPSPLVLQFNLSGFGIHLIHK